MMHIRLLLLAVFLQAASLSPEPGGVAVLNAQEVKEVYPDGAKKSKYSVDKDGKKHGPFILYFPDGKPHIKTTYRHGELHGKYFERKADSNLTIYANYKQGKLNGSYKQKRGKRIIISQSWKQGVLLKINGMEPYPKSKATINKTLKEIIAGTYDTVVSGEAGAKERKKKKKKRKKKKKSKGKTEVDTKSQGDPLWDARMVALRRLMAYRYLCDVPYRGMYLDPLLNRHADAAAKICQALGRLEHKPKNPGWPKNEFDFAYKGTSSSNLYMSGRGGSELMALSVHAYMNDSDPSNIDRLGHRRWCINPSMLKTGFGWFGSFSAMWSFDKSRKGFAKIDFVAYPPRGYLPTEYFSARHAWSISFDSSRKGKVANKGLQAKVFRLDKNFAPEGEAMPMDYHKLSPASYGSGECLIFHPKGVEVTPGARYWVEIHANSNASSGKGRKKKRKKKGKGSDGDILLSYLVEFM